MLITRSGDQFRGLARLVYYPTSLTFRFQNINTCFKVNQRMASTQHSPKPDDSFARQLKTLHKPGDPVIFAKLYDLASLNALPSLNENGYSPVKAVATASYAIAETYGVRDEDLTYEQNLERIAS